MRKVNVLILAAYVIFFWTHRVVRVILLVHLRFDLETEFIPMGKVIFVERYLAISAGESNLE